MRTQDRIGALLLECLTDVATLLDRARTVAIDQRNALVASDPEGIVRTCKAEEDLLRRIAECDRRAADVATELANWAGLDPDEVNVSSIVEAAGPELGPSIRRELIRIANLAKEVRELSEVNHKLLSNGLEVIACCLRTLGTEPGQSAYSKDGELVESGPCILSLDRKA